MTKTLQKKFIVTSMTAITILIVTLLGAINIVNLILSDKESSGILSMISDEMVSPLNPPHIKPNDDKPLIDYGFKPREDRDIFMASTFFLVETKNDGTVSDVDLSRIASLSEADAISLAEEAFAEGSSIGKVGRFKYKSCFDSKKNATVYFFLDTSDQIYSSVRILLLSIGIGLVFWVLMLLLVIALSNRAIRPIAENMEKQKQFVTNAGHELKTPLAVIMANTEAMELFNGENKWTKNIKYQTGRMSTLTENLLSLARINEGSGTCSNTFETFSLSDALKSSIKSFETSINLRKISLSTRISDAINIQANKEQILRLFSVLIDNATKYTDEAGFIDIELNECGNSAVLKIENSCENLPTVSADKLFDRFYRGDEARTQKSGGYGIGLSVAKAIAEANRLDISAEYTGLHRIAFTVKF